MPTRGDLALGSLATDALCKPPQRGSCTDEQTHRNSQWAPEKQSCFKIKTKRQNGFFPTIAGKIQGLTRHWVFQTISWNGVNDRVQCKEHEHEVRVPAANLILSFVLLVTSGKQLNLSELYFII